MAALRRQLVFSRPGCQLRLKAFLVRQGKEDHLQSRPAFWLVISHTRDQRRSARTGSVRISFGQRSNEQTTGPSSFFHSRRKGLRRALRSPSLRPSIYRASQKPWIKLLAPWFRRGRMFPHGLAPRQGKDAANRPVPSQLFATIPIPCLACNPRACFESFSKSATRDPH